MPGSDSEIEDDRLIRVSDCRRPASGAMRHWERFRTVWHSDGRMIGDLDARYRRRS